MLGASAGWRGGSPKSSVLSKSNSFLISCVYSASFWTLENNIFQIYIMTSLKKDVILTFALLQRTLAFPDELVLAMIAVKLEHCFQAFNLQMVCDSLYG